MKFSEVYNAVCALLNAKPVFIEPTGSDDDPDPLSAETARLHDRERFLGVCDLACRLLYPDYVKYCRYLGLTAAAFPTSKIRLADFVFFPDAFIPSLCALCAYLTEYRTEHKMLWENERDAILGSIDPSVESIADIYGNV